jgi:hypothetical protein
LNGIIHPAEFQQSIANINYARAKTLSEKIATFAVILCLLIAMIIAIVGFAVIWISTQAVWITLLSAGGGMFFVFLIIYLCVGLGISSKIKTRMKDAIHRESVKYSTKLSMPITWRLHVTSHTVSYGNEHIVFNHFVSITSSTSHILLK